MIKHVFINFSLFFIFGLLVFSPFIVLARQSLIDELQSDAKIASINIGHTQGEGSFVTLHYEW